MALLIERLNNTENGWILSHLAVLLVVLIRKIVDELLLSIILAELKDFRLAFAILFRSLVINYGNSVHIDVFVAGDVRKVMVEVTMASLVCSDVRDNIAEGCVISEMVVLSRFFTRAKRRPVREIALINLLEDDGVGVNSLLLKVANEAVTGAWRDHVHQEIGVEEDSLTDCNGQTVQESRVTLFKEKEQVHALVLCLL